MLDECHITTTLGEIPTFNVYRAVRNGVLLAVNDESVFASTMSSDGANALVLRFAKTGEPPSTVFSASPAAYRISALAAGGSHVYFGDASTIWSCP